MTRPENTSQEEEITPTPLALPPTQPQGYISPEEEFFTPQESGRSVRTRSSKATLAPVDDNPELKLRKAAARRMRERTQREAPPSVPLEATGLTPSVQVESVAQSRTQVEPQGEGSTLTEEDVKALTEYMKPAVESWINTKWAKEIFTVVRNVVDDELSEALKGFVPQVVNATISRIADTGALLDAMADTIQMEVKKEIMTRGISTLSITQDPTSVNVMQGPSTTNMGTTQRDIVGPSTVKYGKPSTSKGEGKDTRRAPVHDVEVADDGRPTYEHERGHSKSRKSRAQRRSKGQISSKSLKRRGSAFDSDTDSDADSDGSRPGGDDASSDEEEIVDASHLRRLRPNNAEFADVLNFRRYRLNNRSALYNHEVARKMAKMAKNMKLQVNFKFSGKDPIMVIRFLQQFKSACNQNGVHEGAAIWLFRFFLDDPVRSDVESMLEGDNNPSGATQQEMLRSYPEVVNYLLETYATDEVLAQAYYDLVSARQGYAQAEDEFAHKLKTQSIRCGNIFNDTRLKAIFVEGLLPTIRASVRHHSSTHPRVSYRELTKFAAGLGDAQRGGKKLSKTPSGEKYYAKRREDPKEKKRTSVMAIQDSSSDEELAWDEPCEEQVLALQQTPQMASPPSVPTTPTTTTAATARSTPRLPPRSATEYPPRGQPCRICLSTRTPCCEGLPADLRAKLLAQREANFAQRKAEGYYNRRFTGKTVPRASRPPPGTPAPTAPTQPALLVEGEDRAEVTSENS